MSDLARTVERLEADLNLFIKKYKRLESEHRELKEELIQAEERVDQAREVVAQMERENELIRMAGTLGGNDPSGREATKSKISELVREIDKCVAQLNG
ncbi:hypothetical protein HZ996_11520 [Cryomorphaceae bacterium]|nr:hypothetical protein HZ996_11520 [Cryomorphaceae bacterium]